MSTEPPRSLEEAFVQRIAEETGVRPEQVRSASELFDGGATVPFVARYRKEATGGLIDEQLEVLARRREYYLELAERRDSILESIASQGKLDGEIERAIRSATSKQELEDLYLPYRPKRRTRAQVAREKGLESLADQLLAAADGHREAAELAREYVDAGRGVNDAGAALAGARDILAERLSESASGRSRLREVFAEQAILRVRLVPGKEKEGRVYRDYFDHHEATSRIPSHRLLAILRGERQGFLSVSLEIDDEREVGKLSRDWGVALETSCGSQVREATLDGYRRLLRPSIATELRADLRRRAESEAIAVFRANLESLLMQSPLGRVAVLGVDPGYRTGCKLAVVDATGKVVDTGVIHVLPPDPDPARPGRSVVEQVRAHGVRAVAIGNGTGSRETEALVREAVRAAGLASVIVAIIPETGASVYSASALAREELPSLDVSLRGAVSIARRLQDPLAELVKIEPRSLGVGQYQHDVDQKALGLELDRTVERAVNRVGVELNTASASLLRRVSGLSGGLAKRLVAHREARGPFRSRQDLLAVSGFGPRTFEQAAGFLRIQDGAHPLDRTAVHPERYAVVEAMAERGGLTLAEVVGDPSSVSRIDFASFADEARGLGRYTLDDIRAELERPGRDPRPRFVAPKLRDDVRTIDDVQEGMVLEGRISNVTNFGAFVDLGVKRDGLVHMSELSHRWVQNAAEVVRVGQIVKVRVTSVDRERGRISLSMKALQPEPAGSRSPRGRRRGGKRPAGEAKTAPTARTSKAAKKGGQTGKGKRSSRPDGGGGSTTLEELLKKFGPRY